MRNSKRRAIVPCVLAVIFLAAGLYMMVKSIGQIKDYNKQIAAARQELAAADPARAEDLEQEVTALQQENAELDRQVQSLLQENAALDEANEQLSTRLGELEEQEQTAYYQKILESLREGLKRVEEYIGNPE